MLINFLTLLAVPFLTLALSSEWFVQSRRIHHCRTARFEKYQVTIQQAAIDMVWAGGRQQFSWPGQSPSGFATAFC